MREQEQNTVFPYLFVSGILGQFKDIFKIFRIEWFEGSCIQYL